MRNRRPGGVSYRQFFSFILLTGVLCGALPARSRGAENLPPAGADSAGAAGPKSCHAGERAPAAVTASGAADVQLAKCPDARGVVRGRGKITITETKKSAAAQTGFVQTETTTEVEITGYVNKAGELTHFDMKGTTTETVSGGGLPKRLALSVEENKIGAGDTAQPGADSVGRTMFSPVAGGAPAPDAASQERLSDAARAAIKALFDEAAAKFRAARAGWRAGACAEVKQPTSVKRKPPIVDPPPPTGKKKVKCDGVWRGTISVVTKGKRDNPNETKLGGSLTAAVSYRETNYRVDYTLSGERDTSGGLVNGIFADVDVDYKMTYFRRRTYHPYRCTALHTSTQTQQNVNTYTAKKKAARATVYVSAYTAQSSIQLHGVAAAGESTIEQVYSGCPNSDKVNTFTRPGSKYDWQYGGDLVEFENPSPNTSHLNGWKTVQNGDGTETTFTWDLTQTCQ